MGTKMADYGVARLENPDFPHCEKGLLMKVPRNSEGRKSTSLNSLLSQSTRNTVFFLNPVLI
jgi:hypothetical protein